MIKRCTVLLFFALLFYACSAEQPGLTDAKQNDAPKPTASFSLPVSAELECNVVIDQLAGWESMHDGYINFAINENTLQFAAGFKSNKRRVEAKKDKDVYSVECQYPYGENHGAIACRYRDGKASYRVDQVTSKYSRLCIEDNDDLHEISPGCSQAVTDKDYRLIFNGFISEVVIRFNPDEEHGYLSATKITITPTQDSPAYWKDPFDLKPSCYAKNVSYENRIVPVTSDPLVD